MESLGKRIEKAEKLWQKGLVFEKSGDLYAAYDIYTQAHDLIMDCAKLHQKAHFHLRRVNRAIGNYGELITDWLLHFFTPLGVFELVSYFSKTGAFGADVCKRNV